MPETQHIGKCVKFLAYITEMHFIRLHEAFFYSIQFFLIRQLKNYVVTNHRGSGQCHINSEN